MPELARPTTKPALIVWINVELQKGVPRWELYRRLMQMQSESNELKEMQALGDVIESLEDEVVTRNLKGAELEEHGKLDDAIALYEANVADQFDGSHPYDRLRVIYKSRGSYADAIRVCEAYILNSAQDQKLCMTYRSEIEKFKTKMISS